MWAAAWQSVAGFFSWLLYRRDAREDKDRSDFALVTSGYDKLAALLQARVEGLVKEIDELREREEVMRDQHESDRREQEKSNERIKRELRGCKTREAINEHRMQVLEEELKRTREELRKAEAEIAELKRRMDEQDGGKGMSV